MLINEQANQIKEQLLKQLENFPEDQRENIKQQVTSMSPEDFEAFLKQNGLIQDPKNPSQPQQQCIFCAIKDGKIPSHKISENPENIAILEINPLSKGHSLVVPKTHTTQEEVPNSAFDLAKKISKKIKQIYQPKDVKISLQNIMGHSLIEILPLYGDEKERKKATDEDLLKLKSELEIKPEPEKIQQPKPQIPQKPIQLPPRIP